MNTLRRVLLLAITSFSHTKAPSDYYLFLFKKDPREPRCHDDIKLQRAVMQHFEGENIRFYLQEYIIVNRSM